MQDGSTIHAMVNMVGLVPVVRAWVKSPVVGEEAYIKDQVLYGGFIVHPTDGVTTLEQSLLSLYIYGPVSAIWTTETLRAKLKLVEDERNAGQISWRGKIITDNKSRTALLSWDHGMPARYRLSESYDLECSGRVYDYDILGDPYYANSGARGLYLNGVYVDTDHNVVGACVYDEALIYVSHIDLDWEPIEGSTTKEQNIAQATANSKKATIFYKLDGGWEVAGTLSTEQTFMYPWFFAPDGQIGATLIDADDVMDRTTEIVRVTLQLNEDRTITAAFSSEIVSRGPAIFFPKTAVTSETDVGGSLSKSVGDWIYWQPGWGSNAKFGTPSSVYDDAVAHAEAYIEDHPGGTVRYAIIQAEVDRMNDLIALAEAKDESGSNWFPASSVGTEGPSTLGDSFYVDTVLDQWNNRRAGYRWRLARAVSSTIVLPTNTKKHESDYQYKRYVAVDYDFSGNEKIITQEFDVTANESNYIYDLTQYFRCELSSDPATTPTIYIGMTQFHRFTWDHDFRWLLKSNGKELVSASGYAKHERGYTQKMDSSYGGATSNTMSYTPYATESDVVVEQVWLLDMDARLDAVVYSKARVSGQVDNLNHLSLSDINLQYSSLQFRTKNQTRVDELTFSMGGAPVQRLSVPATTSPGLGVILHRVGGLHITPRMFSGSDRVERFVPEFATIALTSWDYSVQTRRFPGPENDDPFDVQRHDGMMSVRDSNTLLLSVSDASNLGSYSDRDAIFMNTLYVNGALIDMAPLFTPKSLHLPETSLYKISAI
jgi:hypothetical protein